MFTLKVGKAENYKDIEQDEDRLRVPFEILNTDGEVVEVRNESFPLGTSTEEVKETLNRHLTVYTEDHIRYEENKSRQTALDASQVLAEEISNITIK